MRANAVVDGATNGDTITINNGAYTLLDTLAHLQAAGTSVLNGAAALSLTDETVAAADLNTLDDKTTVAVNAAAVTALTGDSSDVLAVYAAYGANTITGLGNEAVTLTDISVSVANANTINAATSGVVKATLSGTAAELAELTAGDNAYTITVTDSATPAQLAAIDAATTLAVIYNTIADTAANLAANEGGFITGNANVMVTDTPTVEQLNTINAATSGVVTATLSGTAAELAELTAGDNAYTITVTDAATLDQLAAIDAATTLPLTYEGITGLAAALAADTTYVTGDHAVTVTDPATVTQLNVIDGHTSGVVTATVIEGDMTALTNLTGTGNAYAVTVTTTGVAAAELNTLDGKTTVAVNAAAVTALTGAYVDVAAAYAASTITGLGDEAVMLTDVSVSVVDANTIAAATSGVVTATISEGAMLALASLTETGNAYTVTVTDETVAAADLNTLDGKTTVAVNAAAVLNITGTANDVAQTYDTAGSTGSISGLGNEAVMLSGVVNSSAINTIASWNLNGTITFDGTLNDDALDFTGVMGALVINGNEGDDTITGGSGMHTMNGGDGEDTFIITDLARLNDLSTARHTVDGGEGIDTIKLTQSSEISMVYGGIGFVSGSITHVEVLRVDSDNSNDISIQLDDSAVGYIGLNTVDLRGDTNADGINTVNLWDTGSRHFTVIGSAGADTITAGSTGSIDVQAGDGNDTIDGGTGNDTITGGSGADILNGGDGEDTFIVSDLDRLTGIAPYALNGGAGIDTISLTQTTAMNVFVGGDFQYAVSDVEVLRVDSANAFAIDVYLDWSSVDNTGIRTVDLRGDIDAAGINSVNVGGVLTDFTVYGSAGDDTITGGSGADTLNGGDGDDTFIYTNVAYLEQGPISTDHIDGGEGRDTIRLTQNTGIILNNDAYLDAGNRIRAMLKKSPLHLQLG